MTVIDAANWVQETRLGIAMAESPVLFPFLETLHVVGLTMIFGTICRIDTRLMYLSGRDVPVSTILRAHLPWVWGGFATAFVTGSLLFTANATKYLGNPAFLSKFVLLGLAGLNMIVFHCVTQRSIAAWDIGMPPLSARFAGLASMVIWCGVLLAGRWIGFL